MIGGIPNNKQTLRLLLNFDGSFLLLRQHKFDEANVDPLTLKTVI
jgi:hypothetical protein